MKSKFIFTAIISFSLICGMSSCEEISDALSEDENEKEEEGRNGNAASDDDSEIKSALSYLNQIRENPAKYASICRHLKNVEPIHELKWDENLAKAAQYKAEDMAKRQYFGHTDPEGYGMNYWINHFGYSLEDFMLGSKSNNYFESIACGCETGVETIDLLIYDNDAGNESAGHRRHLLGIDDYYASCCDIGIGRAFNPNSRYRYYWSVLIAKHTSF